MVSQGAVGLTARALIQFAEIVHVGLNDDGPSKDGDLSINNEGLVGPKINDSDGNHETAPLPNDDLKDQ